MGSADGSSESLEARLGALQRDGHDRYQASPYSLPMKLSHGSLGAIEEVFGEELDVDGRALSPKDVATASQAKLDELVELHEWASYWGAQGTDADRWINTYRSELSGRLLVPAARTLNAGVSLAIYADTVLLPDPLNPSNMHTIMKKATDRQFRKLVEYHVSMLALLAPLVRSGRVVFVSADLARSLAARGQSHEHNPMRDLNDELLVETMTTVEASFRALDDIERKHPIRSRLFGARVQYDSNHLGNLASRVFALTLATALNADLFDLIRDGKQFRLPRDDSNFAMRRLFGIASLMMPGLEKMPFGEILALTQGSEVAAEVRAAIGPVFDALPSGLSDEDAVQYLRQVAEEQLQPSLRRLEKEAKALPGAESWMGAAVGVIVPIVELAATGALGPASYAAMAGAPLPLLAGWVACKSDRELAAKTQRVLATALPAAETEAETRRWRRLQSAPR
ncbi:MAG: hypothetical protein M0Z95_03995 [Actinomycetota bacterium]|jgi:hypothetical protein|nr:hypothetical protein [Actinomycetota bacterium]